MYFPVTCVDNFYSNPDEIREYALSLEYSKNKDDIYPGVRTERLHLLNPNLSEIFCNKIFSLFYNFDNEEVIWKVNSYFQKTYQYDASEENKNIINSGWIHIDSGFIFAGVIYLNPHPDLNSGTSIYKLNDECDIESISVADNHMRKSFFNCESSIVENEYVKRKLNHESKFYKTAEFKNVYNRMVLFDSSYWHKQSGFLTNNEDYRLTQVFFVEKVGCYSTPYLRCKKL